MILPASMMFHNSGLQWGRPYQRLLLTKRSMTCGLSGPGRHTIDRASEWDQQGRKTPMISRRSIAMAGFMVIAPAIWSAAVAQTEAPKNAKVYFINLQDG